MSCRVLSIPYSTDSDTDSWYGIAYIHQDFGVNAGDLFYLTFTYSISNLTFLDDGHAYFASFGYVLMTATVGQQRLVSLPIRSDSASRTLHASGVFSSTSGSIEIELYAEGTSNVVLTVDNFVLYAYSPNTGQDAVQPDSHTLFGPTDMTLPNSFYYKDDYTARHFFHTGYTFNTSAIEGATFLSTVLTMNASDDTCSVYIYVNYDESVPRDKAAQYQQIMYGSEIVGVSLEGVQTQILNVSVSYPRIPRYIWVEIYCTKPDSRIVFEDFLVEAYVPNP